MNPTNEIAVLRPIWTEAERKLYPLATASPEKYEKVILLARAVADDLAWTTTDQDLTSVWADGATLVEAAADRIGVPVGDLPPDSVAGVAFALRDAEMRAVAHQQQLIATIASARDAGGSWALLHETGNLQHGLMDPYSAIHLHLATGAAIVSSVEPNPADGQVNHVLAVIRMNPDTGEPVDLDPGIAGTEEYADAQMFMEARVALIARIEPMRPSEAS